MRELLNNHEKIIYEDIGSGIPILFIHPPGMGRKVFYEQMPLTKQFRCILPDLAGQGDSTYDGKSEISIARFAKDLIKLLDHLNLSSVVIFGYSAGGLIAQHISIHYPERVISLIMSGAYPVVDNFPLRNEHRLGVFVVEKNKKFLARVLAFSHTKVKKYREVLREHMYKSDSKVWSSFYKEALSYNCKEEMKRTELPVLLLYGSKADSINTYIKFYKKHIRRLQIHVISGLNHQLPTLAFESVNKVVINYLLSLDYKVINRVGGGD